MTKNSGMNDMFGYMLGPKAENMNMLMELVKEAFADHMYWRRNFHPEDRLLISSEMQSQPEFTAFVNKLRDDMFQYLSDAKKGVPFFSSRYVGHMQGDLLIPALVGYFGAMLYNHNNVSQESSPVTARYEGEVIEMLIKMVGMPSETEDSAWGYLTTGGTAANIFSLWVARNLRLLPFSLRMLMAAKPLPWDDIAKCLSKKAEKAQVKAWLKNVHASIKSGLKCTTAEGTVLPVADMNISQLANVPIKELSTLRDKAIDLISGEKHDNFTVKKPEGVFDELVKQYLLKNLGMYQFIKSAEQLVPGSEEWLSRPWRIYISGTSHYSWTKAADLLGFGHVELKKIPHTPGFDMNTEELERIIKSEIEDQSVWPMFLCSIVGTTEEGSLDNLPRIQQILEDVAEKDGITIWHHADACYGGYLASMIRPADSSKDTCSIDEFENWILNVGIAAGIDKKTCKELVNMSQGKHEEQGSGWLLWEDFISRLDAMRDVDSLSIDPHKLGYIPYPAGAVLFRAGKVREAVSSDAPYLWAKPDANLSTNHQTKENTEPEFTGRYTLEGSRSGATAASCWLAHTVIPLNQEGHGRLLALSILGARMLYRELIACFNDAATSKAQVALMYRPHSNIVCYAPYHEERLGTPDEIKGLTSNVLNSLHPVNGERNYMAVDTTLKLCKKKCFEEGGKRTSALFKALTDLNTWELKVIRSVIMNPYSVTAQKTGEKTGTFASYANYLKKQINESADNILIEIGRKLNYEWKTDHRWLMMDDDDSVLKVLENEMRAFIPRGIFWDRYSRTSTEQDALKIIEDSSTPLPLVLLDIDMSMEKPQGGGDTESGYKILEAIIERNLKVDVAPRYRIKRVAFLSKGHGEYDERIADFQERPGCPEISPFLDKESLTKGATKSERKTFRLQFLRFVSGFYD